MPSIIQCCDENIAPSLTSTSMKQSGNTSNSTVPTSPTTFDELTITDSSNEINKKQKNDKSDKKKKPLTEKQIRRAEELAIRRRKRTEMQSKIEDLKQSNKKRAQTRLHFLLSQSSLFAHFIKSPSNSSKGKNEAVLSDMASTTGPPSPIKRSPARSSRRRDEEVVNVDPSITKAPRRLTEQPILIPKSTGTMRQYQLEGLNWLISLHHNGLNGILADEMGLGKTLQSISILAYMKQFENISGPHLIIAPKSTLPNWKRELNRWCPTLRPVILYGTKAERALMKEEKLQDSNNFDCLICSYEMAIIEKGLLRKHAWRYLIVDEAHRLKNEASKLSVTLRTFTVGHRLLVTGLFNFS